MFEEYNGFSSMRSPAKAAEAVFELWRPFGENQPQALTPIELKKQELEAREKALSAQEQQLSAQQAELKTQQEASLAIAVQLQGLVESFEKSKKAFWEENSQEVVRFAFKLAETVVQKTLAEDPSILASQVRSVIEELKIAETIDVQVAASDMVRLQNCKDPKVAELLADSRLRWHADQKLAGGSVFIDTSQYRLDASVMTAMNNLRDDARSVTPTPKQDK
jgi:flagellar biosynthesis/type III secretory pathway protein FliH